MQRKIQYTVFIIALFLAFRVTAQNALFLNHGNIVFEKKVNTYALQKERMSKNEADNAGWDDAILDASKKNNNGFTVTHANLAFKDDKTLYTPIEESNPNTSDFYFIDMSSGKQGNIVYSDFDKDQSIAQKTVYGDQFLITDSTRKIRWKITDELRDIAGFHCRRANAVIMDSVYVVAFYTNQIPTSGGPESFSGLPGMIMLLALPHQHIEWTATKVTLNPAVTDATLTPPKKGKAVNQKEFIDKLKGSLKDWNNLNSILQNASF
ncbi:hypothetical protein A9P82_03970 [Arachidicoccus ginsenosidimutans]|uniref:GLPGLI family protein n=1 Tax=Arachidicoccus sp. BS20 TaxID=1850526 RepID=UPI0007F0FE81|nr:GLPGLI family protein [Arachidicoccus sp. BS20]ANI88528.1 hypothetical protein A9P82_03970 [Arachidicoccus sp. BS20]